MITVQLTPQQFTYLQDAVKRDLENLEEMAPWDVGEYRDEHKQEMRLCKAMIAMLGKAEQEQVVPH